MGVCIRSFDSSDAMYDPPVNCHTAYFLPRLFHMYFSSIFPTCVMIYTYMHCYALLILGPDVFTRILLLAWEGIDAFLHIGYCLLSFQRGCSCPCKFAVFHSLVVEGR